MQIPAKATPWAPKQNHHLIAVNMDGILRSCGVSSEHVRRRLIAHAIIASGWRQAVWHFNAWGVQKGTWSGDVYVMPTQEEEKGELVSHPKQLWRVFPNWAASVADTMARAKKSAGRWAALNSETGWDGDYWAASKAAKYFTDTKNFHPDDFAQICSRVKREVSKATTTELAAAAAIPVGGGGGGAGAAIGLFLLIAASIIGYMFLGK